MSLADVEARAELAGAYRTLRRSGLPALAAWCVATGRPLPPMSEAEKDAVCDRIARRERLGPYAREARP